MNRSQKVISLQQSSKYVPYPFFKGKKETSMYGNMFFDDFCRYFSIDLGKKNNYRYFYKIDGDDGSLENLLEYDNHMFFQYDFDKLLMNNLANLLTYGKAYVEVVKLFDKDNKLVGIKLLAFRNNIQISLGDKIYYFLRRYDCRIAKDALVAAKSKISGLKVMTIDYDSTTQAKTHLTSISSSTASK